MIEQDLIRQITILQQRLDWLAKSENSRLLVAPFLDIPAKVGLWYAGNVQRSTGNVYDASSQGRTLTYNGNPVFNYMSNGTAYLRMDGVGDYLSRTDETDLDVLGTETIYAAATRGLTMGGWFRATALPGAGSFITLISKWTATGNLKAYRLTIDSAGAILFFISTDGIASVTLTTTGTVTANTWRYIVARFTPSSEQAVFYNNAAGLLTSETLGAGIPASIFNTTAALLIGAFGAGAAGLYTGDASIWFLSANTLSDTQIRVLYQQTRGFFGV